MELGTDLRELKEHGTKDFPLCIYIEKFKENERSTFLTHWHNEIEIDLVLDGELQINVNDQSFTISENEALFVNANNLHGMKRISSDATMLAIVFSKSLFGNDSVFVNKYLNHLIIKALKITNQHTILKLIELNDLFNKHEFGYEWKILGSLATILGEYTPDLEHQEKLIPSKDSRVAKQILSYIGENYATKLTISSISKTLGICKTELCRIFKQETQVTIMDYINDLRIEQSTYLLTGSTLSITEISQNVGFNSSAYFTHLFHTTIGVTPREYRENKH